MADIYLDTLGYYKPEIDELLATEATRVDNALALKSDTIDNGTSGGPATLDVNGDIQVTQIPFAEVLEAMDVDEDSKVINPKRLHYVIDQTTVAIETVGAFEGVCPLNATGKVAATYLEPTGTVSTYVVVTLDERNAIVGVLEGDRCYVTDDPSDTGGDVNGQYLAEVDDPTLNDWTLLPELNAVSTVNGQTGVVEITSITESAANATNATALAIRVTDNETDVLALQGEASTHTIDIADHEDRLVVNEADLVVLNAHSRYDDTFLTTDVDTILTEGTYYVDTNLPGTGNTTGVLRVQSLASATVLGQKQQRMTELEDGKEYVRTSSSNVFGAWAEDTLSARVTYNHTEMTYDYSNTINYTVVGDTYETVNTMTVDRLAGTYQLNLSMIHSLNALNTSAYFQFRLTDSGGPGPWTEIRREPKDNTDKIPLTYFRPFVHIGGTLTVEIESRKENINDILIVEYNSIVVERKV